MPTEFASSELQQALSEIPWGYRSYTLLPDAPTNPGDARVEIRLLDGDCDMVTATCGDRGWTLVHWSTGATLPEHPFDTLDDLMLAVSPAFERLRIEKLLESLANAADTSSPPKPKWAFED
ncbi:hypothetical protein JCM8115_000270 [Rhodotorula mucilaginosa]